MTASLGVQAFIFDIGWGELVLIGIVALIVIGPKELPAVLRTFGQYMTKIRRMAAEFQSQFQEAMREAEMAELKQNFDAIQDAAKDIRNFDPAGSIRNEIESAAADKPADAAPSSPATGTPANAAADKPADAVPSASATGMPAEAAPSRPATGTQAPEPPLVEGAAETRAAPAGAEPTKPAPASAGDVAGGPGRAEAGKGQPG